MARRVLISDGVSGLVLPASAPIRGVVVSSRRRLLSSRSLALSLSLSVFSHRTLTKLLGALNPLLFLFFLLRLLSLSSLSSSFHLSRSIDGNLNAPAYRRTASSPRRSKSLAPFRGGERSSNLSVNTSPPLSPLCLSANPAITSVMSNGLQSSVGGVAIPLLTGVSVVDKCPS